VEGVKDNYILGQKDIKERFLENHEVKPKRGNFVKALGYGGMEIK